LADTQVGDANSNMPVGTTVALLERGTKVMSAIHKRLHSSQRFEFSLLAKVFAEYLPAEYPYMTANGDAMIKSMDFDNRVDVLASFRSEYILDESTGNVGPRNFNGSKFKSTDSWTTRYL
jgi:hypothetical protein